MRHIHWMIGYTGLLAALLWLGGCASTGPAPVRDLSSGHAAPATTARAVPAHGPVHTVRRGDTLYSIAFRSGVDYRDLAAHNGIAAPYTIHVGQQVRLDVPRGGVAAVATAPPVPAAAGGAAITSPVIDSAPVAPAPSAFEPVVSGADAAAADEAVASIAPAAAPPEIVPAPPESIPAPATPVAHVPSEPPRQAPTAVVADIRWQWPADGSVLKGFVAGDQSRRGLDIAGQGGDPVHAAADGMVVYSGNGLIGYGELVIIKHNDTYLSAYGHNRTRLVAEGANVKGGQLIAEMGSTGSRQMLHFEIRKNGKPVNPMDFLPRR